MKKFLSVLLAVMMVLSTVSFAAPSLADVADTAVETPVVEETAEEAAELAAASTVDEFGTLLVEINFDTLTAGSFDFLNRHKIGLLGGSVTADSTANAANVELCNGSGTNYPGHTTEVVDKGNGDMYLKLTANAANNYNLLQLYTGTSSSFFTDKEGYLTVVYDYMWIKSDATVPSDIAYNRSQQAEAHDQDPSFLVVKDGNWGTIVSSFDNEQVGISGIGGNSATMTSATMVNYIKIQTTSGFKAGDQYAIDNLRLYWRPKTVDVTIDVEGGDDIVLNDYDTVGMGLDTLGAMLPAVEGKVFVGFSLEKGGELLKTTKFASDCTVYPVYEERVNLPGSLEFTTEAEFKKAAFRQSGSCVPGNALGTANTLSHDATNGYLKATFQSTDPTKCVQDTGINLSGINIPAGVLTNIEIKVRFTGMPTTTTTLNQFTGGTRTYNPASVNFPQYYFTTGGVFSTKGESLVNNLTNANNNWMVINYTVEELGITDLTTFRFDFCDFMPHGSTLEIDYIRFIGRPTKVNVDNGDNTKAPVVDMTITSATTVAEVEAMYAKDHGDMKFVGLSRTPNGEVLASTDLVSPEGTSTTLYAIWDDYEYLTYYSVEFNNEAEEAKKVRIQQNCNNGTTVEWNKDGYISLISAPKNGAEASWDHQIFVETFNLENPIPAGVVSQIAVRARFRNVPTEKKAYTVDGKASYTDAQRTLNPANAPYYVYITDATASKWAESGHLSTINMNRELVEGEWYTYYVDAEKFANGMSFARFDSTYPMPEGMVWDVDYIRFLGDNQDDRLPTAKYLGEYGEKVFTVDFDDAATGAAPTAGKQITEYGAEVNSTISTASNGITFTYGASGGKTAPTVTIAEKSTSDKYLTYTLNAESTYSYFFFSAGQKEFVGRDGYFIVTFDFKSDDGLPVTFRMNKHDKVQDTAENFEIIENGEWDKAILYYDSEIGASYQNDTSVTSTKDVSIVKWHPISSSKAGQTLSIDNFTLWFVPKTVKATIDLSEQGMDNVVIKDYPTKGMSRGELELTLPTIADYEVTGLALTQGGDALYQNRVATEATLYPIYEKVNLLPYSVEFNSKNDVSKLSALSSNAFRIGKNSALSIAEQYVVETENGRSFLRLRNQAANGKAGAVVDYGFWVANPIKPSEIKEIVINMRVPEWAASGKYTRETGAEVNFNPQSMVFQLYFMDATGATVKKEINPVVNAVAQDGAWFTITIDGSQIPADAVLFRLDPPDFIGHGTTIDIDYVRFYGEPIPDAVPLKWSADFDTNANGVSLVSWMKEDGTYMFDDGVNGDKGPGIGSKYLTDGAEGYITWNEEGYVTLNFDANDEVKAAAEAEDKLAAVYDPSIYVASLDGKSYIPAGSFDELKIRMRLRGLPADGTAIYGQNYSGLNAATFSMASYPVYFHWMNSTTAVKYDGVQTKRFDDTCKFVEGSYVADEWFTVSIPASFFEADVEDLATLRINLPDWTPDGTKIDIDYIKFMGKAPEASAPVTDETPEFRAATATKANAIRFKATVNSATNMAASDIGWFVTTAKYLEDNGVAYENFDASVVAAAGSKVVVGYNREVGVDKTTWFDSSNDEALVFAGALKNVPAKNALDTLVVRPVVVAGGEYFYGDVLQTSLYEVAVEPYLNWISEGYEDMAELVDSGEWTFDDCIDYDFEYNDDYYDLSEEQQTYIEETLVGLLG